MRPGTARGSAAPGAQPRCRAAALPRSASNVAPSPAGSPPVNNCPPHCAPMNCRYVKPDLCNEPCVRDIQDRLGGLERQLDNLDLLQTILDMLQNQGQAEAEKPQFVTVSVPVVTVADDGSISEKQSSVTALREEQNQVELKFAEMAKLSKLLAPMKRHMIRSYNLLGGDEWFHDASRAKKNMPTSPIPYGDNVEKIITKETPFLYDVKTGESRDKPSIGQNLPGLIRDIATCLYYRSGYIDLPGEVPNRLLAYPGQDKPLKIINTLQYDRWLTSQLDSLIGQFPIEIEIEDADPTKQGKQTKKIELPNISEGLAEIYGLAISGATNADVAINFLMRISAELIATKNSTIVTQDYAKANAAFLGYKGNPVRREIDYAFNPARLDTLDQLLQNSKGYVQGWEEDDKESVVGFLQRIVFSAGIIKTVFFRNEKRLKELKKELDSMLGDNQKMDDQQWADFLEMLNTSGSPFNQVKDNPVPKVDKEPNFKIVRENADGGASGSGQIK